MKEITLFNKNHKKIKKLVGSVSNKSSIEFEFSDRYYQIRYNPNNYKKVKKKSPLGFYYIGYENQLNHSASGESRVYTNWYINLLGNCRYTITYISSSNGVHIGVDLRPWEIVDKIGFEDHFINDLFEVVNRIFDDAIPYKIENLSERKAILLKDLYGNPKGPVMIQTNDQKIEAHGFDLKESFRKPKEK